MRMKKQCINLFFSQDYQLAKKNEQVIERQERLVFKVNIVSAITMIAAQSITDILQAVTTGDPAEHNLSYS